jgi:hypothetical protein
VEADLEFGCTPELDGAVPCKINYPQGRT